MLLITINRLMRKQWARVNIFMATLLFAWTVDASTGIQLIQYHRLAQAEKEARARPVAVDRDTGFPELPLTDAVMWRGHEMVSLGRFYRPGLPAAGLGPNWRLTCDEQFIVAADGSARAELAESTELFKQIKPDEWQTVKGALSKVVRMADGQYVWTLTPGTGRTFARDGWLIKSMVPTGGFLVERDAAGRATSVVDFSGNRINLKVAGGAYREMVNSLGGSWKYEIDRRGRLVKVERPAGGIELYGYQENGMLETVDQGFGKISLVYDDHGRVVAQKVGARELENRRYVEGLDGWEMTLAVAGKDEFTYRRLAGGRTLEYQSAGDKKIVLRLDDREVPVLALEGVREVFSGKTDAQGHLILCRIADFEFNLGYSSTGLLTKIADGQGRKKIDCQYDDGGRLVEEKVNDQVVGRIQWTGTGQCSALVLNGKDKMERRLAFDYDGQGRLRSMTANDEKVEFQSDALGRIVQIQSAADKITMAYNAESQPLAAVRSNGERIEMDYDPRGLPVSLRQGNQKLGFGYDESGNLSSLTGVAGDVTKFGYDVFDRLCKAETAAGTFATEYDAKGRVSAQQMPGGSIERFFYDQENRLSRAVRGSGAIEFSYGADDKVSQLRGGALGDVQFQYGREGALTGWKDSRGEQIEIREGAVVFRNSDVIGVDMTRRMIAGKEGAEIVIESKCLPQPIRKILDAKGKVTAIESPAGRFEFTYDAAGRRSGMKYPNGVMASFTYNDVNQPVETKIVGADKVVQEQWIQTYDGNGRCVRIDNATGLFRKFTYDDADRLTQVVDGKGMELERYEYDAAGNRMAVVVAGQKVPVVRDAQSRLVSQGGVRYAYDAQGRRISQTSADGRQWRYDYDGLDRLVKAATPAGTVQYGYSLLGARLWSQKEGEEKRYSLYAGLDKVAEVDAGGRLLAGYIPGLIADEVLASCDKQGNWIYHHRDSLLNLRMLTDAKGISQARPECSAFGEPLNAVTAKLGSNRVFAGTEYDADTGLCYVRARYYDPATAQFVSLDPLGWQGGPNPYSYCDNDPLQHRDPSGELMPVLPPALLAAIPVFVAGALIGAGMNFITQVLLGDGSCWENFKNYSFLEGAMATIWGGIGAVTKSMHIAAEGISAMVQKFIVEISKAKKITAQVLADAAWEAIKEGFFTVVTLVVCDKYLKKFIEKLGSKIVKLAGPTLKKIMTMTFKNLRTLKKLGEAIVGGLISFGVSAARKYLLPPIGIVVTVAQGVASIVSRVTRNVLVPGVLAISHAAWTTMGTISDFIFGQDNVLSPTPYGTGLGTGTGGWWSGGSGSQGGGSTPITLDPLQ